MPTAFSDYRAMGGIDGKYPQVKTWLVEVLPNFLAYSYMLGNFDVHIDGDTASSRTICVDPMCLAVKNARSCYAGSGMSTSSSAPPTAGG